MRYNFKLYSIEALRRALKKQTLLPYKEIDGRRDERWNTKLVNSKVAEAITMGKAIPDIAKSFRSVLEMDKNSSIRNARTAMTSAQNAGRFTSMKDAEDLGIVLMKQWVATHDGRTRHSHAALDGETIPTDEEFTNGLMYPGDEDGDPEEVYNCRCAMISVVEGIDPKSFNPNARTR